MVTVFDRREDAPEVTRIEIEHGLATIKAVASNGSGNPSERRDGLAVPFWCETCEGNSELMIAQHKGQSFVGWRKVLA
jgi:hypothetical protein